jgi:FkbM family methyltransferase
MSKFRTVIQIYENRGLQHLLYRVLDSINVKLKERVNDIFNIYWDYRGGKQTVTINGTFAEFSASSDEGGIANRSRINAEYDLIEDLLENIKQEDVFYDIGANTGLISNFAGQICSKVIAFEPYPPNYYQLNKTLSGLPADIQTYKLALADSEGEVDFSATGGTGEGKGSIGSGEISVNKTRGDKIISQEGLEQPDVVKIDVEGAEGLVIDGMKDSLGAARRIYCEIHLPADHRASIESYGWTPTKLLTELESLGFGIRFLNNRGPEIQIIAESQQ